MIRILASLLLLLNADPVCAGGPRFQTTVDGQLAVDQDIDFSRLPSFQWASDPFMRTGGLGRGNRARSSSEIEYKLQATTLEGEDSIAVVNDQVVRVGDRVAQRTVLKIGADYVLLGEGGSVIEATLDAGNPDGSAGRSPASSAVPEKARSAEGGPAMKAGAVLDGLSDGKISIEEVKK